MAINVLIVDDSKVVRHMIEKTLHVAQLPIGEVYQAADGQEGLTCLENHWIDLVLVDINMPVMTGEEMIDHMQENPAWADLPVIVVSTEGSETRIERLKQKGVTFVHKPFSPEVVSRVVTEILGIDHVQRT